MGEWIIVSFYMHARNKSVMSTETIYDYKMDP